MKVMRFILIVMLSLLVTGIWLAIIQQAVQIEYRRIPEERLIEILANIKSVSIALPSLRHRICPSLQEPRPFWSAWPRLRRLPPRSHRTMAPTSRW